MLAPPSAALCTATRQPPWRQLRAAALLRRRLPAAAVEARALLAWLILLLQPQQRWPLGQQPTQPWCWNCKGASRQCCAEKYLRFMYA